MKKLRKRRGMKQAGYPSSDICSCGHYDCNPMLGPHNPIVRGKMDKRRDAGVCIACGHKPCTCKSKM